ncbi:MAG: hypothetical protein V5B32_07785 [Candidatus Accumulibacter sp. UW26]|jgi:hypothetical protein
MSIVKRLIVPFTLFGATALALLARKVWQRREEEKQLEQVKLQVWDDEGGTPPSGGGSPS